MVFGNSLVKSLIVCFSITIPGCNKEPIWPQNLSSVCKLNKNLDFIVESFFFKYLSKAINASI